MQTIFHVSGSNSQKTKCLDINNVNRLMLRLLGEIAIYFEAHAEDKNRLCEPNEEFFNKTFGSYSRGKSPILGRFSSMGKCIISYRDCCALCLRM